MSDDLARRRLLDRLGAHAARHPELVDHDRADPDEWLAVLAPAPGLATSSPDSAGLTTSGEWQSLASLAKSSESDRSPTPAQADSVCKPAGPNGLPRSTPQPRRPAEPGRGE